MKSVLISINKPHTDNIFSYLKGLEWRKKPLPLGLHYVYETKNKGGCGKVIGEMQIVANKAVDTSAPLEVSVINMGCVHPVKLKEYANNGIVYANFIEGAKLYDKPRELREFFYACDKPKGTDCSKCIDNNEIKCKAVTRPPQSWCYVESEGW